MSKEQIQTICDDAKVITDNDNKMIRCHINIKNFDWLIEQAERVEELEQQLNKQVENGYLMEGKYHDEVDKNKRYREALKFYADEKKYDYKVITDSVGDFHDMTYMEIHEVESEIYYDCGEKAIKALEGEE